MSNREAHAKAVRLRQIAARAALLARIGHYLSSHPCVDCGETDIRCLEFDHRDRASKLREVTKLVQDLRSWRVIEAEIQKCDVRCANCHRRKTGEEVNSWRQRLFESIRLESCPEGDD